MILTNNPDVLSLYPTAIWVDGGPIEVLLECRKNVHGAYPLLVHPLMGDEHLMIRNPFRTVILGKRKNEIDLISLSWVEESLERIRSLYRAPLPSEPLEDYQSIDLDLFQKAFKWSGPSIDFQDDQ